MNKDFQKIVAYFITIIAITLFFVTSTHMSSLSTAAGFEPENSVYYSMDKPLKTEFPFEH